MKKFKFIELDEVFLCGNTRFKKTSTRTAKAIDYSNKVFYFSQNEYSDRIKNPIPVF
jgi:hypothetical protein